MRLIAMSVVSCSEILVKRLVTSKETRNVLERFALNLNLGYHLNSPNKRVETLNS